MMQGESFLKFTIRNLIYWWSIRATAEELLKEYKACESADYITYVSSFVHSLCLRSCQEIQGAPDAEQGS